MYWLIVFTLCFVGLLMYLDDNMPGPSAGADI